MQPREKLALKSNSPDLSPNTLIVCHIVLYATYNVLVYRKKCVYY